jgi:hypothetical protein
MSSSQGWLSSYSDGRSGGAFAIWFLIHDSDPQLVLVEADLDSSPEKTRILLEENWSCNEHEKKAVSSQVLVIELEKDINDGLWLSPPMEDEDTQNEEDRLFQAALGAV